MINTAEAANERQNHGNTSPTGAHAFDDVTDLENEEFIVRGPTLICVSNELI